MWKWEDTGAKSNQVSRALTAMNSTTGRREVARGVGEVWKGPQDGSTLSEKARTMEGGRVGWGLQTGLVNVVGDSGLHGE